jgi:DNA-binding response OmpR family regulator
MTADTGRVRFAIVEDDPFMAQLVCEMLVDLDEEPLVFSGGMDLLRYTGHSMFHTTLLDLSLPDIDGFDLMDKLAAQSMGLSLVLMSGHDPSVLRAAQLYGNGLGLNVRGVLCKPFTKTELIATLGVAA